MINVLLTDGEFTGMIRTLRDFSSKIRIIGFCSSNYCAHTAMLDAYYVAPDFRSQGYEDFLLDVITKEKVDYIFPVGTLSLEYFAEKANEIKDKTGAFVITSKPDIIKIVNNKALLYQDLSDDAELSALIPEFRLVKTFGELRKAVAYFKSKGMSPASKPVRGENAEGFLHFVSPEEYSEKLLKGQASHLCSIDSFSVNDDDEMLPEERIVMPFLSGKEWDADVLADNGNVTALTIRENKDMFGGLSACTVTADNDAVSNAVRKIIKHFGYSYLACISFKEDKNGNLYLLEINPRAMGSIYVSTIAGNDLIGRLFDMLGEKDLSSDSINKTASPVMASLYYDLMPISNVKWNDLKASDREVYEKYYSKCDTQIADYTFHCRFAWDNVFKIKWAIIEDCLVQFSLGEVSGFPFMLMPMGDYDLSKLKRIITLVRKEFDKRKVPFRIACVDENKLELFQSACDFKLFFNEDFSDYLYDAENLRSLAGRNYSKKRNHLSQFARKYPDYEYVSLTPQLKDECLNLVALWAEEKQVDIGDLDNSDYLMIRRIFDNWDDLNVRGGAIIIDGHVRAFSIGSYGNRNTAFMHFEKANAAYEGTYAAINKLVIENEYPDAEFVNREEDLGIAGLRQSKESYFPICKLKKYRTN